MAQTFEPSNGPTILSRGGTAGSVGSEPTSLTFTAGVNAIYDNGLISIPTSTQTLNSQASGYGVEARATLFGTRRFKRSSLGISYSGSYQKYNLGIYDGTNQSLQLTFNQQLSKKFELGYNLTAGTSNLPAGNGLGLDLLANANSGDPNLLAVPVQELFNIRTTSVQGGFGMTYRFNNRLSFRLSANGYGVRRDIKSLGGVNGYSGKADLAYRFSKRTTVSVSYNFNHMEYPGAFGASDIHTMSASYARGIGRDWQLSLGGGVSRVESLGLARVELDPFVAALLGQSSGVEAFYSLHLVPNLNGNLTRTFRTGNLIFNASKTVVPGNGLFLTSQSTNFGGSYAYTGIRDWSLRATLAYTKYSTLTRTMGQYTGANFGAGVSRKIYRTVFLDANFLYRDQIIAQGSYSHNGSRLSAGLAWSPKSVPLSIW